MRTVELDSRLQPAPKDRIESAAQALDDDGEYSGDDVIRVSAVSKVFALDRKRAIRALGWPNPLSAVADAGGHLAVDDLAFDVAKGEFFVIVGLSGSGKTTLLRMLNGLVPTTAGTVSVDGMDLTKLDRQGLRDVRNKKIAMVFQYFGLFPHRTVAQNVVYGLKIRGRLTVADTERVNWAIREVGLARWESRFPSELSGGMQQRIGIARALATDAEILHMDEPFSAFDPLIRTVTQHVEHDLMRNEVTNYSVVADPRITYGWGVYLNPSRVGGQGNRLGRIHCGRYRFDRCVRIQ